MAAEYRNRGDALAAQGNSRAAVAEYAAALKWQPDDGQVRERHDALQRLVRKRLLMTAGTALATVVVVAAGWALLVTRVQIQIDPALTDYDRDLQILLDGKPIVSWQSHRVLIGKHKIQALNPRYRDFEQDFTAVPLTSVAIVLRAEPRAGDLRIESHPSGALVWVNGEARGQTPLDVKGVRVPSAVIRVQKQHFIAKEDTLQVADGSRATFSYTLVPNPDQPVPPISQQVLARLFPPTQPGGNASIDRVERGSFSEPGAVEALVQVDRGGPQLWLISADDGDWTSIRKIIEPRFFEFRVLDVENDGQDEAWIETHECHQGFCTSHYELRGLSAQGDRVLFRKDAVDESSSTLDFTGEATRLFTDFADLAQDGTRELVLHTVTNTYANGNPTGERATTEIYAATETGLEPQSPERFPSQLSNAPSGERFRASLQQALPAMVPLLSPDMHGCKDHTVESAVPVWARQFGDSWLVTARVSWWVRCTLAGGHVMKTGADRLITVSVRPRADRAFIITLPARASGRPPQTMPAAVETGSRISVTNTGTVLPSTATTGHGSRDRVPIDLGAPFRDAFDSGAERVHALVGRMAGTLSSVTESQLLEGVAGLESLPRPQSRKQASARKLNEEGLKHVGALDYPAAIVSLESAYTQNPTDIEIVENLGYAHLSAGNLDQAEFYLMLATLMNPRRATSWSNLGQTYALRNDPGGATACFLAAYTVSRSREVTRRFYNKLHNENPHAEIRAAAEKTLAVIDRDGFSTSEGPASH